jgi:hypothetical protein
MAIKISGVNVIDSSQNLSFGISTVGSGNSAITINSSNMRVGSGVTFDIVNGNINASLGIVTASRISFPLGLG